MEESGLEKAPAQVDTIARDAGGSETLSLSIRYFI